MTHLPQQQSPSTLALVFHNSLYACLSLLVTFFGFNLLFNNDSENPAQQQPSNEGQPRQQQQLMEQPIVNVAGLDEQMNELIKESADQQPTLPRYFDATQGPVDESQ